MLKKDKPNYDRPTTLIGKDTMIEGTKITSRTSIQINGSLLGDAEVDASVVIGESGKVKGNITTNFLLIAGKVDGNVKAVKQLHVTSKAVINGDIECGTIIIDEGASLNGMLKMLDADKAETVSITENAEVHAEHKIIRNESKDEHQDEDNNSRRKRRR